MVFIYLEMLFPEGEVDLAGCGPLTCFLNIPRCNVGSYCFSMLVLAHCLNMVIEGGFG